MFVPLAQGIRSTKKLMITLRHPGPTQVIASILPILIKTYDRVAVVATDTALLQLQERFQRNLYGVDLYYRENGLWQIFDYGGLETASPIKGDSLEFGSSQEDAYKDLVVSLSKLIMTYLPDIVLRTTPAMKWGVDEGLVDACRQANVICAFRCYQEYYNCGINIESFPCNIATVDTHAKALLQKRKIGATVTGWLNQAVFEQYRPYSKVRKQTRTQLGINDGEKAVIYCTVSSGDLEAELNHFELFIKSVKMSQKYLPGIKVFIRFHPRNKKEEREAYARLVGKSECVCVNSVCMDGVLSFSDFMVSAASAINLDVLQYQVMAQLPSLMSVSVLTAGKLTDKIVVSATGQEFFPASQKKMGSLIVSEDTYENFFCCTTEKQRAELYECAKKMFDTSAEKSVVRFLKYLECACG